jgi:predicted RND superfamily exporter protein
MPFSALLSSLYDFLSYRRGVVYAATLGIMGLCVLVSKDVNVQEDIRSMLPDSPSELRIDFELMRRAPFARKVIINLKRRSDSDPGALNEAVESLRKEMSPPYFSHVVSSPGGLAESSFFVLLFDALPNLSSEQDIADIAAGVTPQEIEGRMKQAYMRILSPEGWGLKGLAEIDPLGLRQMILGKLRFLRLIPRMRLGQRTFLSEDGMNALLIADTHTAITDSRGAQEMLDHFQGLVDRIVPPEIEVSLISGHRYAAANAEIIKRDLFVVLGFSTIAIFAIFVVFLRNWRAIFVFLVPVAGLHLRRDIRGDDRLRIRATRDFGRLRTAHLLCLTDQHTPTNYGHHRGLTSDSFWRNDDPSDLWSAPLFQPARPATNRDVFRDRRWGLADHLSDRFTPDTRGHAKKGASGGCAGGKGV